MSYAVNRHRRRSLSTSSFVVATIVVLALGRNNRIGDVVLSPIEHKVQDIEVIRTQHIHVRSAEELASEPVEVNVPCWSD